MQLDEYVGQMYAHMYISIQGHVQKKWEIKSKEIKEKGRKN